MVAGELVFTLSVVVGVTDVAQVVQPATATISLGADVFVAMYVIRLLVRLADAKTRHVVHRRTQGNQRE